MKNLRQQMREYLPIAAVWLLCIIVVPTAQASTSNNGGSSASATAQQATGSQPTAAVAADDTNPAKAKQKVNAKPREKSVLDAEVLESPIAYFRNSFSSEEDGSDAAPSSSAMMVAVKALVAALLSTIM